MTATMEHNTNKNVSLDGDSSLSESKFIKMVKHVIIDVPVLEELRLSERSIYKVPCNLRNVKKEAYTPFFISIGPIHFGEKELMPMQEHKLRYLQNFWKRVSDEQMETYKHYLETKEEEIRRCYAEKFPRIDKEKFVDMILLDAVFIMELFLRNCEWKSHSNKHEIDHHLTESFRARHNDDLILTQSWLSRNIARDLILLENQIPFSVLEDLYERIVPCEDKTKHTRFLDLAIEYFAFYDRQMSSSDETKKHYFCVQTCTSKESCMLKCESDSTKHFTDHKGSSFKDPSNPKSKDRPCESPKHFTELIRSFYIPTNCHSDRAPHVLRTATKLRDSGVSFEKGDVKKKLLEITFDKTILSLFLCFGCFPCLKPFKATLRIPQLKVNHTTECVFRNLIAFEQCQYQEKPYICNYVSFIDSLIHTKQDVDMLVEKEVIVHELGSDEEVATLVNSLCKHVVTNSTCYYKTINELNDHYLNQWYHTVAALRFVYFRDLWRASSTVVGIAVLIFAVFQFLRAVPVVLYYHP